MSLGSNSSLVELRPYQTEAIELTRRAFTRVRRVVLVLPVGSGKTVVAAEMIRRAAEKGRRVLFLVHRIELVHQAVARLAGAGIEAGTITADSHDVRAVTVASIQTLHARKVTPPADLLFLDECHHARAKTWTETLARYPDAWIVGLTATPFRLDGQGLGDVFEEIVVGVRTSDLCNDGVLVEPDVYAPPGPDLAGVRVRRGDFEAGTLAAAMEKPRLVGDIVTHWERLCAGRRTIVFATSIRHSQMIAEAFGAHRAVHVDGRTSSEERAAALHNLALGAVPVLSNCDLFGEGTDVPALECAILARPTASRALHLQQIGRIMRAAAGKEGAVVLDHAGNTHRHGLVTDHIEYTLAGKIHAAVPRIVRCPQCFVVLPHPLPVCPECGYVWPEREETERAAHPDVVAGTLVKFTRADEVAHYTALIDTASRTGRRIGWARHAFKERFGKWPRHPEIERGYVCTVPETIKPEYGAPRCARCLRPPHDALSTRHDEPYMQEGDGSLWNRDGTPWVANTKP